MSAKNTPSSDSTKESKVLHFNEVTCYVESILCKLKSDSISIRDYFPKMPHQEKNELPL